MSTTNVIKARFPRGYARTEKLAGAPDPVGVRERPDPRVRRHVVPMTRRRRPLSGHAHA